MPTASPAASKQPKTSSSARTLGDGRGLGRWLSFFLAVPLAVSFGAAQPMVANARAGQSCSSWHNLSRPPDTIRVLRLRSGRIDVVNFRKYVVTVMGKEWPSYLPKQVIEAGAVAVKQYAWYHAVFSSRASDGRCFDVKDGTGDQLYRPRKSRVRSVHHAALAATWNVTLRKFGGRFFMTGYRRGNKVRCGRDATGYKLYARSATRCARKGYSWRQILRTYYGPNLDFIGDGLVADRSAVTGSPRTVSPSTDPPSTEASANRPQVAAGGGFGGGAVGGLAPAIANPSGPGRLVFSNEVVIL